MWSALSDIVTETDLDENVADILKKAYCTLDRDRLNTIRSQLQRMQVIFIDEISMVGSAMFNFLDLRLQQIMGTKDPFGSLSIITVGDLFQLKPVFDNWIFENSKDDYAALATHLWQQYFQMFELSEVMRQREDKDRVRESYQRRKSY